MNKHSFLANSILSLFIVACFAYSLAGISPLITESAENKDLIQLAQSDKIDSDEEYRWEEQEQVFFNILQASFQTLTIEEADRMGIIGGARLTHLMPGVLTTQTPIKEGFIINSVNGKGIYSVEHLFSALKEAEGKVLLKGRYDDLLQEFNDFTEEFEYEIWIERSM